MALIVNGEKIEDSALQQEVQRLRPDYERVFHNQPREEREAQLLDWSKENIIERILLAQHAKKHIKSVSAEQIESAFAQMKKQYQFQELSNQDEKKIKKDIEQQLKLEKLLREICKDISEPSNQDVQKFYEDNKEQFKIPEKIRVAHIVKHVNFQADEADAFEAIKAIQHELKKGESFETLAGKFSDCPENGGDLGHITKGQMVEEFEDVAFNLSANQVSDIFQTRFGFHIAKLYDRKAATLCGLEEARNRIINQLSEQKKSAAVEAFVDKLKEKAKIEEI